MYMFVLLCPPHRAIDRFLWLLQEKREKLVLFISQGFSYLLLEMNKSGKGISVSLDLGYRSYGFLDALLVVIDVIKGA